MIVLLPCYSLEDFSLYRGAEEADEIFSAWSALYHPALLELSSQLPSWEPAGSPPIGRSFKLIVVPPCCEMEVGADNLRQLEESGALLVRNCSTREEIVAESLRLLAEKIQSRNAEKIAAEEAENASVEEEQQEEADSEEADSEETDSEEASEEGDEPNYSDSVYSSTSSYQTGSDESTAFDNLPDELPPDLPQDIIDSFYALGLAYFISDLLTRKLRYMSDIDTQELENRLFLAVKEYRDGNADAGKDALQKSFDLICEATEYYFPTPAKFLDLTWLEKGDCGEPLLKMLLHRRDRNEKTNLFLNSDALTELEKEYPETLAVLREEAEAGRVETVLGDEKEEPLYMFPQMKILQAIQKGRDEGARITGVEPVSFGRYQVGWAPVLPQLLSLCGYKSAFLFAKDGWTTDFKNQNRINWKGQDGTSVPSLAKQPLDGEKGSVFMELLDDLGYSWHDDDVMTSVYAHRPGKESPWWSEVARFNRFAPILGEVIGLKEYFELTQTVGPHKLLGRDDFRTNSLTRAAKNDEPEPVSRWSNYYTQYINEISQNSDDIMRRFFDRVDADDFNGSARRKTSGKNNAAKNSGKSQNGFLIYNPFISDRLVSLPGKPKIHEATEKQVLLVEPTEKGTYETLLRVPALSQIWLDLDTAAKVPPEEKPVKKKKSLFQRIGSFFAGEEQEERQNKNTLVEFVQHQYSRDELESYYSIQNEYFELRIDPTTGALKRLGTYESGDVSFSRGLLVRPGNGNRLSSQVVLKLSEKQLEDDHREKGSINYGYTLMSADKFQILSSGPLTGILQISGRLVTPGGETAAKYEQVLTVRRGSRVIEVEINFKPTILPTDHAWENYYGCRFVWGNQFAEVRPGIHERLWKSDRDYFQAPECLDIRAEKKFGITFLSGGFPYYRQYAVNRLDAIFLPANESKRSFRFGIGVDLPRPMEAALEFMAPCPRIIKNAKRPHSELARLLDVTSTSGTVLPIELSPLEKNGKQAGLKITFLETGNVSSKVTVHFPVPVQLPDQEEGTPEIAISPTDKNSLTFELKRNQLVQYSVWFGK